MSLEKFEFYKGQARNFSFRDFAERFERLYFSCVFLAALLGYGLLLFFPLMVVGGIYGLLYAIGNPSPENQSIYVGMWVGVIALAAATSYYLFTVRLNPRFGVSLPEQRSHELYEMIESNSEGLMAVKIHDVQLTDTFELKIVKVPVYGFPIWSKNVLCIGFDFIQILSKDYFNYALVSKLKQFSKKRAAIHRWLAQLSDIWLMYPAALRYRNGVGDKVLAFFFELYAKFYKNLAIYVLHKSDLVGDDCGLAIYGDYDILEGIEAQALAELFLQKHYWPNFIKENLLNKKESDKIPNPYTNMPTAIQASFSEERLNKFVRDLNRNPDMINSRFPSLKKRIENLGHTRTQPIKPWVGTAAKHYFGNHYSTVVSIMAKYWWSRHASLYESVDIDELDQDDDVDLIEAPMETEALEESSPPEPQQVEETPGKVSREERGVEPVV